MTTPIFYEIIMRGATVSKERGEREKKIKSFFSIQNKIISPLLFKTFFFRAKWWIIWWATDVCKLVDICGRTNGINMYQNL